MLVIVFQLTLEFPPRIRKPYKEEQLLLERHTGELDPSNKNLADSFMLPCSMKGSKSSYIKTL